MKFVLIDLMMIQRIRLPSYILKLTAVLSAEQIAEQQRQADVGSQTNEEDESSDDGDVI